MSSSTIGQMFFDQAEKLGSKTAVLTKQIGAGYQPISWSDFSNLVEEIAFGLASLSLAPGQLVAIFSPTSYLWVAADLAIISNGAISVPLYPNCSSGDIEYILNNSEAEVIFVAGETLLAKIADHIDKIPKLQKIIFLPGIHRADPDWQNLISKYPQLEDKLMHFEQLCVLGEQFKAEQPQLIKDRLGQSSAEDIITVIYTSGTTGAPKGVPLTHANILGVISDFSQILPVTEEDVYFSYLPVSHVFERVCGEFYWLYSGGCCAFAESIEAVSKNMGEAEPTLMLAVPRVLDRIYTKVKNGIEGASSRSRQLINWAIAVGGEIFSHRIQKKEVGSILKLKHKLAEHLVLKKLRERIGKRLRFIVTGGAPATAPVLVFFNSIGIPVFEGYGLTETTAPTNVNYGHRINIGTVGPVLSSVALKIAEDGEILFKGPGIFQGYFKDEESTKDAFVDGWFRTGDVGCINDQGFLTITDRKKDLIVNAAGKNIAPQRIESILRTISPVSQAIVFGDRKRHLVALLTIDDHRVGELAREKGWSLEDTDYTANTGPLFQYLKKEINLKHGQLAEYERIRRFAILKDDLSIESGELTASMKVKRTVVLQKYAQTIENLYQEDYAMAGEPSSARQ